MGLCFWWLSWTGPAATFWPGKSRLLWTRRFVYLRSTWRCAKGSRRFSTATRAHSLRARTLRESSKPQGSGSAWMAGAGFSTTSSSSGRYSWRLHLPLGVHWRLRILPQSRSKGYCGPTDGCLGPNSVRFTGNGRSRPRTLHPRPPRHRHRRSDRVRMEVQELKAFEESTAVAEGYPRNGTV